MTRDFLTVSDLSREELIAVLDRAAELKALRGTVAHPQPLQGKSVAVVFEKASTRTRLSFEVGIHELGAQPVTLISCARTSAPSSNCGTCSSGSDCPAPPLALA